MNKEVLAEAIGNIDDRYILESIYGRRSRIPVKIIAAIAACVVCVLGLTYALRDAQHEPDVPTEYFNLPDVSAGETNTAVSRTDYLTPLTPDCTEREMTKKDLEKFFGTDDYSLFEGRQAECKVVFNGDKSVHAVRLKWYFDEGIVSVLLEPKAYPEAIFNSSESVKSEFGAYSIATHKLQLDGTYAEYDVGMKKDDMGAWIFANDKCKTQMEELINYIISSDISFDLQ